MKIAMMSGAYVNAGDFLIEQRSKMLIETILKESTVDVFKRSQSYETAVEQLNSYDVIVFTGGPIYQKSIYPDKIPFVNDLSLIEKPIMILGAGWKGSDDKEQTLYGKQYYTLRMKEFLTYIHSKGVALGCRDWETVSRLKKEGFSNVRMTGCPAWYDLKNICKLNSIDYEKKCSEGIKKIIVSDAALRENSLNMKKLIVYLREEFSDANIKVLFHRGIVDYHQGIVEKNFLENYDISVEDISGSAEGFKIYDSCDLHIGFRVHAHIYNLSRGNISILINEDARGIGVNNALGLRNISLALNKRWGRIEDGFLEDKLRDYFFFLKETKYLQYKTAGNRIQSYYPVMEGHVKELEKVCR